MESKLNLKRKVSAKLAAWENATRKTMRVKKETVSNLSTIKV